MGQQIDSFPMRVLFVVCIILLARSDLFRSCHLGGKVFIGLPQVASYKIEVEISNCSFFLIQYV